MDIVGGQGFNISIGIRKSNVALCHLFVLVKLYGASVAVLEDNKLQLSFCDPAGLSLKDVNRNMENMLLDRHNIIRIVCNSVRSSNI